MNKSVQIWFAINKNGDVRMFLDCPKKNVERGIWESKNPYVNSLLYKDILQITKQAKMNFENEPECLEIQINYQSNGEK